LIHQKLAPNLYITLVRDLPDVMLSVHSEDVARFQKPIEELFTIALENAKKRV
jgi:hypothetical protein